MSQMVNTSWKGCVNCVTFRNLFPVSQSVLGRGSPLSAVGGVHILQLGELALSPPFLAGVWDVQIPQPHQTSPFSGWLVTE